MVKEYKGNTWISKNKIYRKKKYANKEKSIEKDYYYEKSIKELTEYIRNNEKNPNERHWNRYALEKQCLSSETIGYLCGIGFNKLCRKIRKQINTENRKSKNAANKNK